MIGDVAAGQWVDPFTRDPSTTRPVAITRRAVPWGTSGQLFCRLRLRSGSALPAPQATERFLILIVGRSHLDRRAALRLTRTDVPVRFRADFPLLQVQPLPRAVYADATLDDVEVV